MIKYIAFTIVFIFTAIICNAQNNELDDSPFTCFARKSIFNYYYLDSNIGKWIEHENDTVISTRYIKGSLRDLPNPENMGLKVIEDTLVFDFGRNYDPNIQGETGSAAIYIDFVLNKHLYPNYEKLINKFEFEGPK
ncbi:hypothetical protein ERX46_15615 [Brumimicrobium glaciale]|uniref:Uncharacterized protein n=1 Tax=Brumimicrobium glaciale TaxID=200475 RepID=A0A4Q4KH12_9FLAO|nr:hypothetical protein [Brumimicrobium glaciale]RYM32108.1 hypothetical protein ERX46_15615 [Brumimicrobium glaciale]